MMATDSNRLAESYYSLAFFRIIFGLLMAVAGIRFIAKGWITDFYVKPQFFFSFYGFEWIRPLPAPYIYWVFYSLVILALFITAGLFYRFSIIAFFIAFTYVELLDKSVYLNHYYQISLLSFLMIFLPMNRIYSLDNLLNIRNKRFIEPFHNSHNLLKIQVGMVYFFGGIAKLKYDWLFLAQPLRIWLAANEDFPIFGPLLTEPITAYALSWLAMIFDLSAPFLLWWSRTRIWIYILIVIFHLLTHALFYIGMFPWIMIFTALIFFPSSWHKRVLRRILDKRSEAISNPVTSEFSVFHKRIVQLVLILFFVFQWIMPFRHYYYGGNVLWHEQGFRFGWNIMLMEKNGVVEYQVKVKDTGKEFTIRPSDFLTKIQVRQMSFQPDMILQFAHYLHDYYLDAGMGETEIRAECYASVNGHGSQLLIDPTVDLVLQKESFLPKSWITRF